MVSHQKVLKLNKNLEMIMLSLSQVMMLRMLEILDLFGAAIVDLYPVRFVHVRVGFLKPTTGRLVTWNLNKGWQKLLIYQCPSLYHWNISFDFYKLFNNTSHANFIQQNKTSSVSIRAIYSHVIGIQLTGVHSSLENAKAQTIITPCSCFKYYIIKYINHDNWFIF